MSFISIMSKVGQVALGVGQAAIPVLSVLQPQLAGPLHAVDGIFQRLQQSILAAEGTIVGEKQGAVRAGVVREDFNQSLVFVQEILSTQKKRFTYDEGKLTKATAAQVEAYNAMAELKESFKIVDA